jgi:hypothetical protein
MSPNPSLNLAPFSRWTLRDKAAQRRLALRYVKRKMIYNLIIYFSIPVILTLIAILIHRKDHKKGFFSLLILLLFILFFRYVDNIRSYYQPGTRNFTLSELLERNEQKFEIFRVDVDGKYFILAEPKLKPYETLLRLSALTTTAPMYIFNNEEIFLDWTNNLDDDQEFYNNWSLNTKSRVTIEEIRKK